MSRESSKQTSWKVSMFCHGRQQRPNNTKFIKEITNRTSHRSICAIIFIKSTTRVVWIIIAFLIILHIFKSGRKKNISNISCKKWNDSIENANKWEMINRQHPLTHVVKAPSGLGTNAHNTEAITTPLCASSKDKRWLVKDIDKCNRNNVLPLLEMFIMIDLLNNTFLQNKETTSIRMVWITAAINNNGHLQWIYIIIRNCCFIISLVLIIIMSSLYCFCNLSVN